MDNKKQKNNNKIDKKHVKIAIFIVILILIITLIVCINIKNKKLDKISKTVENRKDEVTENVGIKVESKLDARQDESKDLIANSTIAEIKIESAKMSVNSDDTSIAIDISNTTDKTITDLKVNFILLDGSDKEVTKVQGVVLSSINPLGMASIDIPVNKNLSDVKSLKIEKYI